MSEKIFLMKRNNILGREYEVAINVTRKGEV